MYGSPDARSDPQPFAGLMERLEAALAAHSKALTQEVRSGMLQRHAKCLPSLHAFAMSLTRNQTRAEDLVQERLLKGWGFRRTFSTGTNLTAWLFEAIRGTNRPSLNEIRAGHGQGSGSAVRVLDTNDS